MSKDFASSKYKEGLDFVFPSTLHHTQMGALQQKAAASIDGWRSLSLRKHKRITHDSCRHLPIFHVIQKSFAQELWAFLNPRTRKTVSTDLVFINILKTDLLSCGVKNLIDIFRISVACIHALPRSIFCHLAIAYKSIWLISTVIPKNTHFSIWKIKTICVTPMCGAVLCSETDKLLGHVSSCRFHVSLIILKRAKTWSCAVHKLGSPLPRLYRRGQNLMRTTLRCWVCGSQLFANTCTTSPGHSCFEELVTITKNVSSPMYKLCKRF